MRILETMTDQNEQPNITISYIPYDDILTIQRRRPPLDEDWPEEPRWTLRRVIYLLVALVIIVTFLVYVLSPLLSIIAHSPPPPPTAPPALL